MNTSTTNQSAARDAGQKKSKLVFTIRKDGDRRFQHLEIEIMEPKEWSTTGKSALLSIKWQADGEDWSRWYGGKASCAPGSNVRDIGAVMQRAAKVASKLFPNGSESPAELIATLAAIGIQRAAYDSRVSCVVTEKECQDLTLKRYMNDYTRDGGDGCTVAVLAADSQTAMPLLAKAFAERIGSGYSIEHYAERFAAWMSAGQPVKLDAYAAAPDFTPINVMLNVKTAELLAA